MGARRLRPKTRPCTCAQPPTHVHIPTRCFAHVQYLKSKCAQDCTYQHMCAQVLYIKANNTSRLPRIPSPLCTPKHEPTPPSPSQTGLKPVQNWAISTFFRLNHLFSPFPPHRQQLWHASCYIVNIAARHQIKRTLFHTDVWHPEKCGRKTRRCEALANGSDEP